VFSRAFSSFLIVSLLMFPVVEGVEQEVAAKFECRIESASHESILEYLLFPWRGDSS